MCVTVCVYIIAVGHTVAIKTCRLRAEEVYRIVFIIFFLTTLLLVKSSCCETTTGERDEPSHRHKPTLTQCHQLMHFYVFGTADSPYMYVIYDGEKTAVV